ALSAGQRAGGDKRGQQSAALLVVRDRGGYGGFNDRWIDVRVDDHPAPIEEVVRVFNVYDVTLLDREDPTDVLPLNADVVRELQAGLTALGFYRGAASGKFDSKTKAAFEAWGPVAEYARNASSGESRWSSKYPLTAQWIPYNGPYGIPSEPKHKGMPRRAIRRNGLFFRSRSMPRRVSYTSPGPLHCPMKFGWHEAMSPASFVSRSVSSSGR